MKRTDKETEQKIIELYNSGLSMKAAGEQYGVTSATVKAILERNNIPKRTKKGGGGIYKLPEEDIIAQYKNGASCQIIADKYKVTFHTISNILEKNGVKRDNIYHNLNLIENYWDNIDSLDKAYFLGFLLTDGNVIGNAVRLQLSSKDRKILEIFSQKTKNENTILDDNKRNLSTFGVKRKCWVEDLSKYGIVPNKTYITEMPNLSEDMMPHLIRGMIDGDGWISYKSHQIGFCGSEKCVTQLRDYLVEKLGVFNVKILHPEDHLWQITWASTKDIISIGNFIYNNKQDCYLERKFDNWKILIHGNTEVSSEIAQGSETL